jgi:DNA adenine methylase
MTYPNSGLRPLIKWTGGKRRELGHILANLPTFAAPGADWKFVEPFFGGGAVFFALGHTNAVINDADEELVNFYRVAARGDDRFLAEVDRVAGLFEGERTDALRDAQALAYYEARDLDRGGLLAALPDWRRAARFFVVNQLAFSGMRRFNAAGEFNVPFGHYKSFNGTALRNQRHTELLAGSDIMCGGYDAVLAAHDTPNTFIFIDPPYTRVMKTYSAGSTFGDEEQRQLAAHLKSMKNASWMVVIDRSPLTEELYGDNVALTYPVSYGVNIKNRFDQAAEHILATNYPTSSGLVPPSLTAVAA